MESHTAVGLPHSPLSTPFIPEKMEEQESAFPPKSTELTIEEDEEEEEEKRKEERIDLLIMDFDDFDATWPLDQISVITDRKTNNSSNNQVVSPLYLPSSDHPFSPLWAFAEGNDDAALATAALPDCSGLLSCTPNSVPERLVVSNDNYRRLPSPLGLSLLDDPDGYCVIKERMTQALRYFKDLTEQNVLAQVWVPVKNGSRHVLTTSGQPFFLGLHSNGLHLYRMVSQTYTFPTDEENNSLLGLPGRVFLHRVPEWTPNVQYYSISEYPRRNHAQNFNVQGSLALPVFEPSGQSCVGVLELVMTTAKINYAAEVDKVCKALEAVNLKSSKILGHPSTQICNEGRQNALAEILEILTVVCETHKLPLAQTWLPCMHGHILAHGGGLKKSCSSFDGSCVGQVCMSTTDASFYVVDAHMWRFRDACVEHHLQKGQGVAGRAFLSHNSCFCGDITLFCKKEYPLVHYARMFRLASCFAICLQSSHTGDDNYVLEFFLPPGITDFYDHRILLGSLLATMKEHFQSLKVASGVELEEEVFVEIVQVCTDERADSQLESVRISLCAELPPTPDGLLNIEHMVHLDDMNDKGPFVNNAGESHDDFSSLQNEDMRKTSEKKRGKTEKSISLEVLQQYFAGSLKDAAKSLGVCPTTMKRICRQHGISRWPSRKIKKVNRSLSKLKRVIESVQGAEGAFGLSSLTPNPLPVAVSSQPSSLNRCDLQTSPSSKPSEPQEKDESPTGKTRRSNEQTGTEDQLQGGRMFSPEKLGHDHSNSPPELGESSKRFKTGSGSWEESAGTPTSQGSCQGSPQNETTVVNHLCVSSIKDQCIKVGGSPELAYQPTVPLNISATCSIPDTLLMTEAQETFGGMLIQDAGSSKDLRNLCPSVADAVLDEQVPEFFLTNPPEPNMTPNQPMVTPPDTMPHVTGSKELKSMTIKATYREDIIRFRISLSSGSLELKEEVAKRLKLEVGTFDIKYLDDDNEWVLITCDADLQECTDVSRSSGSNIIRLLVQDIIPNLGSSCENSG